METAVVYWSGTGNTEMMANAVADGINKAGGKATVVTADSFGAGDASKYEKIAFGCPSMGDEVLEEDVFEPMFQDVEKSLNGKKVVLFGSYDWGDGKWMRNWEGRTKGAGAVVVEALIANNTPSDGDLAKCEALGEKLVKA